MDAADQDHISQKIRFSIKISDKNDAAEITIIRDQSPNISVICKSETIDNLISELSTARKELIPEIPYDITFDPPRNIDDYDPRWYIWPNITGEFATFWIRNSSLGWSGYGFPRHEIVRIVKFLKNIAILSATSGPDSHGVTSVQGDNFLFKTDGLGFYYYGKGESRIGPNPFAQIEFDSDRATGIVAGSVTERRLEQAIVSRLRQDVPDIKRNLFRPSGPLGSFSSKIDLSYMMNLISDDAYKDLLCLKSIRNDFAHHLDFDSFDIQSIKDRCNNLQIVDRHIGPIKNFESEANTEKNPSPYMGLPDHESKLKDPRFRFVMTAQLISNALGQGADNPERAVPYI